MEGGDRPGGVALQVVKKRGGITVGDAFENVEVHFHQLFDLVEHAPDHRCLRVASDLLHLPVGEQINIELGPDALDELRELHADVARHKARRVQLVTGSQESVHQRHVVLRGHRDSVKDHHRLDLAVHDRGEKRVLDAADQHRLVDHGVLDAPQAANFPGNLRPARSRRRSHEQGLEVRPVSVVAIAKCGRQPLRRRVVGIVRRLPFTAVVAVAAGQQRATDPAHKPADAKRVVAADAFGEHLHQPRSGIGEKVLERVQFHEGRFHWGAPAASLAALRPRGPGLCPGIQLAPTVQPCRRRGEQVIQRRYARGLAGHEIGSLRNLWYRTD